MPVVRCRDGIHQIIQRPQQLSVRQPYCASMAGFAGRKASRVAPPTARMNCQAQHNTLNMVPVHMPPSMLQSLQALLQSWCAVQLAYQLLIEKRQYTALVASQQSAHHPPTHPPSHLAL